MKFRSGIIFSAIVLMVMGALLSAGCSKDEDDGVINPGNGSEYMMIYYKGDSFEVYYDNLETFDVTAFKAPAATENDAIWLYSFVDTVLIPKVEGDGTTYDARNLYAYRIEGDDGFSASVKGYPDNIWDQMDKGYVMALSRRVVFPDDLLDLPGAYNVKDARNIRINRMVNVTSPDSSSFVRLCDMNTTMVENDEGQNEEAVSLSDMVEEYISNPAGFMYNLQAIDGYSLSSDLSWDQLQTGYWLMESEKTIFTPDSLSSGRYRVKYLEHILVKQ